MNRSIFLFLVLGGFGCISPTPEIRACSNDAPCPSGYDCVDSVCRSNEPSDGGLADGGPGDGGSSGDAGVNCTEEDGCNPGERCQDGTCRQICLDSSDCPESFRCADNLCFESECSDETDCTAPPNCRIAQGATCEDGLCIYLTQTCLSPPEDSCENNTLTVYSDIGTCSVDSGACSYATSTLPCSNCAEECRNVCATQNCSALNGGCRVTGFCVLDSEGQPSCNYENAPDGNTCSLTNGGSGVCQTGACVECRGDQDCDDKEVCTTDSCNSNVCQYAPLAGDCDDNNACTQTDLCVAGRCVGSNPVVCAAVACRSTGICNALTGICDYALAEEGTACNDSIFCTAPDECNALGECTSTPVECASPPSETCFVSVGVCEDDLVGCVYDPSPEGTACDDGDPNTENDACDGLGNCIPMSNCQAGALVGECLEQTGLFDDVTGLCETRPRAENSFCDDSDLCTVNDVCDGNGFCRGEERRCDSNGPCEESNGACNPVTGACEYPPEEPGRPCEDGDLCTTDLCDGFGNCLSAPVICDKPDDACRVEIGICQPDGDCEYALAPSGTSCDEEDSDPCTVGVCEEDGECTAVQVPPEGFEASSTVLFRVWQVRWNACRPNQGYEVEVTGPGGTQSGFSASASQSFSVRCNEKYSVRVRRAESKEDIGAANQFPWSDIYSFTPTVNCDRS